jgi:hypothetical protein
MAATKSPPNPFDELIDSLENSFKVNISNFYQNKEIIFSFLDTYRKLLF